MKTRPKQIVAIGLILRRDNTILFKVRKNTGFMPGYWALPGGHVESTELAADAALRELKEEVGVSSSKKFLQVVHVESCRGTDGHRLNVYFEVTKWIGEPRNAEPHKAAVVAWMDPTKSRGKRFVPNEQKVLHAIKKDTLYTEFDFDEYIEEQDKLKKKESLVKPKPKATQSTDPPDKKPKV